MLHYRLVAVNAPRSIERLTLGAILGVIGFLRICLWHFLMSYGIIDDLYGEHCCKLVIRLAFHL
jgi:hypothetical protein